MKYKDGKTESQRTPNSSDIELIETKGSEAEDRVAFWEKDIWAEGILEEMFCGGGISEGSP